MKPLLKTLVLLFVQLASTGPTVAYDGKTAIMIGGPGGSYHSEVCQPDDAMKGIVYDAGKDLNMVSMICAPLVNGSTDDDHLLYGRTWGTHGEDNGQFHTTDDPIACPAGMVVQAIHGTQSAVKLVHTFWFTCRNLVTKETVDTPAASPNGGAGGRPGYADCGNDFFATGYQVRNDHNINALGLICATYRTPALLPPVAPPAPPPPLKKPPHAVDNAGPPHDVDNGG